MARLTQRSQNPRNAGGSQEHPIFISGDSEHDGETITGLGSSTLLVLACTGTASEQELEGDGACVRAFQCADPGSTFGCTSEPRARARAVARRGRWRMRLSGSAAISYHSLPPIAGLISLPANLKKVLRRLFRFSFRPLSGSSAIADCAPPPPRPPSSSISLTLAAHKSCHVMN